MIYSLALFGVGAYFGVWAAQQLKGLVPTITGPDSVARHLSKKASETFKELVHKTPKRSPNSLDASPPSGAARRDKLHMSKHNCRLVICPCLVACFHCRQRGCGDQCCRPVKAAPSSLVADLVAATVLLVVLPHPVGPISGGGLACMAVIESIKNRISFRVGKCPHCRHPKHGGMTRR